MRIVALSNIVNIRLNKIGSPYEIKLFYKLNEVQNSSSSSQQNDIFYYYNIGQKLILNQGQSVQFYNRNNNFSKDWGNYYQFSITGNIKIQNSINSLINNSKLSDYCFYSLFKDCKGLTSIPQNLLPSTTLANDCYSDMFYGCTGLTNVPNLPATTLANDCYSDMFYGCTGLTNVPNLPATTLTDDCYNGMFSRCTGLTNVPNLPATTLASTCYQSMFYGCTGLTSISSNLLPATNLFYGCYSYMFYGCTGLTTISSNLLPATTLTDDCYSGMFSGCTGLTNVPNLPATTLTNYCYNSMFSGCTGLTNVPNLPATTLASNCYKYMFSGCTGIITAPNLPATTLYQRCYYYMFNGCSKLSNITIKFNNWNNGYSTGSWLVGVKSGININISKDLQVKYGDNYLPQDSRILLYDYEFPQNSLKFISNQNGSKIILNKIGSPDEINLYYKLNNNTYYYKIGTQLTLNNGQNVQFYNIKEYFSKDYNNYYQFSITGNIKIQNSINSLINNSNNLSDYCFYNLFKDCNGITSLSQNLLPSTTLVQYCYDSMFNGCSKLSNITINFTDWNGGNSTVNWLVGVKSGININISKDLQLQYDYNYLPQDSIISLYDYEFPQNSLKFISNQNGSKIILNKIGSPDEINLYYKLNNNTYSYNIGTQIILNQGQSVQLYNENNNFSKDSNNYYQFNITGNIKIQNSINSLINNSDSLSNYCFYKLFKDCTGITSLSSNLLPFTTLSEGCYSNMFQNCSYLQEEIILPAINLIDYCYYQMFKNCIRLSYVKIFFTQYKKNQIFQCFDNIQEGCIFFQYTALIEKQQNDLYNSSPYIVYMDEDDNSSSSQQDNYIGDYAFYGCKNLSKVTFNNVNKINNSLFQDCTKLSDVTLNNTKYIGKKAFKNCSNLKQILTNDDNYFSDKNDDSFEGCSNDFKLPIFQSQDLHYQDGMDICRYIMLYKSSNDIIRYLRVVLDELSSFTSLQKLFILYKSKISKNNIITFSNKEGIDFFDSIKFPKLTHLYFENYISNDNRLNVNITKDFLSIKTLQKIYMSDMNVISIDEYAFYDCINLDTFEFYNEKLIDISENLYVNVSNRQALLETSSSDNSSSSQYYLLYPLYRFKNGKRQDIFKENSEDKLYENFIYYISLYNINGFSMYPNIEELKNELIQENSSLLRQQCIIKFDISKNKLFFSFNVFFNKKGITINSIICDLWNIEWKNLSVQQLLDKAKNIIINNALPDGTILSDDNEQLCEQFITFINHLLWYSNAIQKFNNGSN